MALSSIIESEYRRICAVWREKHIDSREALDAALADFPVYFAYNSGRIENERITYHDTREVFENGRAVAFTGDPRTLFEIQNQKACHAFLLNAFGAHRALDEGLLLETHLILTAGTYDERRWSNGERPGTYKQHDYVVGLNESGMPAEHTAQAVGELLGELDAATPGNILTVAAYFHASLESIHPFADGNGRTGRALMNYLLASYNHPPIIVYDDDKLAYYGALEAWDMQGDLDALRDFLAVQAVKTWSRRWESTSA